MAYDGKIIIDTEIDQKGAQKGMVGLDSMIKGAAVVAGVGAIANGIKEITASVLGAGMGFESRMSGIQAVSGATAEEMSKLQAAAMKAGEDTVYSASESAQAIEELIKAGLSTEQVLKGGLTGALNLAAAGELGLADAAEIASTALNAFKDDGLSMTDAANILAGAANASATDVMGLKLGLSQCAAVASGAGMSFRDTSTALALFAQNSLKGSDAGTSLKTMLMNLQPQTSAQIALFQQLGIVAEDGSNKFFDETGQLKSLADVSGVLRTALQGMSDQQRSATLETMFGTDAIRAANVLYKEGAQGVDNMWASMSKVTAADVAAERLNNLAGSVEFMKGSLETLGIKIYESFKGPLKDAVNYISDAISAVSAAFDSPELKDAFETIANAIRDVAKAAADFVAGAIPGIVKGFAGLISAVDFLSPLILAAGAAFLGYKAVTAAVTIGTNIMTAAQWAYNAAQAANPVGLIVAAAAAAAVGFIALANKMSEANRETRDYVDANQKLIKSLDELEDRAQTSAEAYAQKISDMDAENSATDALVEKIIALNRVQGRTAEQNAELAASAELLNSRVADSGLYYDDLNGTLSLTEEQLRGVVAAQDATRRQEAGTARLNELYDEQAKATAKVKELEESRVETAKRFNALWGGNEKRVLRETLDAQTEALKEAKAAEASYGEQIKETSGQVAAAKKTEQRAVVKTTEAYKVQTAEAKQAAKEAADAQEKAAKEIEAAMKRSFERSLKYSRNMWKDMEQEGAISIRKMTKNLINNTKDLNEWTGLLKKLMQKGLDEGIIAELEEKGPVAAKQARVLVNSSDKEIRKLNTAYRNAAKAATKSMETEFADKGFTGSGAKAIDTIATKTQKAADGADFEGTGEGIGDDLQGGVEGKTGDIEDAAESTIQKAKGAALQEVRNKDFDGVGRQMDYGIARGIRQGTGAIVNAVEWMVDQAIAAARRSLQIASPSKRGAREIGGPLVDGIAQPFKDGKAAESFMGSFVDRMVAAAQFHATESSRSARFSSATLALAGAAAGGMSSGGGDVVERLVRSGVLDRDVYLDGEKVGKAVAPAVSRNQGAKVSAMKRSGYRGR
jgi:TP901 family phage tail tape measure protein